MGTMGGTGKPVQLLWNINTGGRVLKLNPGLPHDSAIPPLGIYPKEWKAGTAGDSWTPLFTAALFTRAAGCKQHNCPVTDEQTNQGGVHTVDHYPAFKRKNILTHATTWVNLENKLSETSQTQILYNSLIYDASR